MRSRGAITNGVDSLPVHEITERLLARHAEHLEATANAQRAAIVALVFELGGGDPVTIPRDRQREADLGIAELEWHRADDGALVFIPHG